MATFDVVGDLTQDQEIQLSAVVQKAQRAHDELSLEELADRKNDLLQLAEKFRVRSRPYVAQALAYIAELTEAKAREYRGGWASEALSI